MFGLGTLRGADAGQPPDLRPHPHATPTTSCCACTTSRAPRRRSSSTCRAFEGRYPVEMFGRTRFPRIGELPYLLTLAPRGFFWFLLEATRGSSRGREPDGRQLSSTAAALVRLQVPATSPTRDVLETVPVDEPRLAIARGRVSARGRTSCTSCCRCGRRRGRRSPSRRLRPRARAADATTDADVETDGRHASSSATPASRSATSPSVRADGRRAVELVGGLRRRADRAEGLPPPRAPARTPSSRCCASSPSAASSTSPALRGWYASHGPPDRRDARRSLQEFVAGGRRRLGPGARGAARRRPSAFVERAARARRGRPASCTPCSAPTRATRRSRPRSRAPSRSGC